MYKQNSRQENTVMLESREKKIVTCPHCWTEQHSERNLCYWCGAKFIFQDELEKNDSACRSTA